MTKEPDSWWRVERAAWRNKQEEYSHWLLKAFLHQESCAPEKFDDSPMPTSLEYLTAWRRL